MRLWQWIAWDVGVCEVVFESDSKIVCNALLGLSEPPVVIANIIEGIQHYLRDFRQFPVSHIRRQGNRPAHILAQYAKHVDSYVI